MSQAQMMVKTEGKKLIPSVARLKIVVPKFDNTSLIRGYAKTVIGRCMNPLKQDMKALLYMLPRIWQIEDRVVGADLGLGRFQFDFDKEEDIVSVLKMEPFHFDYWMLAVVRWEPVVAVNYPYAIKFWIRVIGVPLHFLAAPTFETIGGALGEVKGVDLNEGRIQVILDGFKPLVFDTMVEFDGGEETLVSLRYEKLYGFCKICHSLCHDQTRCPSRPGWTQGNEEGLLENQAQGSRAASYKTATIQNLEKKEEGSKQQFEKQQFRNSETVRGYTRYSRTEQDLRPNKLRNYREGGEGSSRDIRRPNDLPQRYAISTKGLGKLQDMNVGIHLSENELIMMEAFNWKEFNPVSARENQVPNSTSKACKALVFEEESREDDIVATNSGTSMIIASKVVETEKVGDQTSSLLSVETEIEKQEHITVGEEKDKHNTLVAESEETVFSVSRENSTNQLNKEMETPFFGDQQGDETMHEAEKIEHSEHGVSEADINGPKKRIIRAGSGIAIGGTKKRLVQALISPRKKAVTKHMSKGGEGSQVFGEKGPPQQKKNLK